MNATVAAIISFFWGFILSSLSLYTSCFGHICSDPGLMYIFRDWCSFSVWNYADVLACLIIVTFSWQLWSNVHTAFTDQPDLVELAESLSQNFESLYEQEVCRFLSVPYPFF